MKIHGFISGNFSFGMLKTHAKDVGTFCIRFSSQGGLAIDYVTTKELKKAWWKYGALKDVRLPSFQAESLGIHAHH